MEYEDYPYHPTKISKIYITGPLTPSMPYIVLKELALEQGIIVSLEKMKDPLYYIKIFKKIAKFDPPTIRDLNNPEDFENSIYYVNPMCEWKDVDLLRRALMFLNFFRNAYEEEKIENNNSLLYNFNDTGLQTPDSIYNSNACIM